MYNYRWPSYRGVIYVCLKKAVVYRRCQLKIYAGCLSLSFKLSLVIGRKISVVVPE